MEIKSEGLELVRLARRRSKGTGVFEGLLNTVAESKVGSSHFFDILKAVSFLKVI